MPLLLSSSGAKAQTAPIDPVEALNRASASELAALPGIGPATARAIVGARRQIQGFRSFDELFAVPRLSRAQAAELARRFAAAEPASPASPGTGQADDGRKHSR